MMFLQRMSHEFPAFRLQEEVDRLFNGLFDVPSECGVGQIWRRNFPAINLWEEGESLVAEAEVPGMTLNDLEVFVQDNELTIKGTRPEKPVEVLAIHRRERGIGGFARTVQLPLEVDPARVEANLREGVLTVKLPKTAAVMPRKIEVKA